MIPDSMLWGMADKVHDFVVVRAPTIQATTSVRPGKLLTGPPEEHYCHHEPGQLHTVCPNCGKMLVSRTRGDRRVCPCGFME